MFCASKKDRKTVLRSFTLEHLLVVWYAAQSNDLAKTPEIQETCARRRCSKTTTAAVQNRRASSCMQIFLPPISQEPSKTSGVHIHGNTPGCTVYEAAMTAQNSAERELAKSCLHKLLSAQKTSRHSLRHPSDEENVTKKETFDEHTSRRTCSFSAMFILTWQSQDSTSASSVKNRGQSSS